jgi:hypothetical protein
LGEARQHLAHSDTLKKAQDYLHKVAPELEPSVLEACLIALFPLGFTFLIVLMAAGSTQAWWIDQQFRVLGTTTNATLTDVGRRGKTRYYAQYEYAVPLPNQTLVAFRTEEQISMELSFVLGRSLRQATPQRKPQVRIEYLPSHPARSRLQLQDTARPAWLQGVIVGLLVSLSNLMAVLGVGVIVGTINPRASAMWVISGATLILIGSYIGVFWFALFRS